MTTNTNATLSRVHRTAPERIYLCIGDDKELLDVDFSELAEITWSHDQPLDITITYVRADVAALSTAAQPPADGALNTIAAMFHSAEEIEGPDGLAMMVDMSVWNDALDAFEGIIGDEMEPAQPPAGIWVPTELAERVQETIGEFLMDHGWRQQDMDTYDEFGALLAVATKVKPAPPDYADAYQGAREDLAIWKRRALEAESALRKERETSSRLAAEVNEANGPTHLGEPVQSERVPLTDMQIDAAWGGSVVDIATSDTPESLFYEGVKYAEHMHRIKPAKEQA